MRHLLGRAVLGGAVVGRAILGGRRLVRTVLEITVLSVGWLLGGVVGIGTVLYAFLIGPATQFFLPMVTARLDPPRRPD